MARVVNGGDISLNHGAIFQLVNGRPSCVVFYTKTVGVAKLSGGTLLPKAGRNEDPISFTMRRLAFIEDWITRVNAGEVEGMRKADYLGIEGYALRKEQGAHALGEVGAVARLAFWHARIPFRVYGPGSVKKFFSHDGNASKEDMIDVALEREGFEALRYRVGKDDKTAEDAADALAVARLVDTEVQLRRGKVALSDLHKKEIEVFNAATKHQPVNILARPWIQMGLI